MSRIPQVKNRAPAAIQITAEQLLREANDRGLETAPKPPKQFITDHEELLQYQQQKRKDFEDQLRRQVNHIGIWTRYALWEAAQKEFERARSVFERALDIDYRNQTIWLKYAEMEMKNKFINHARNIWDRCVTLLPRVDSFWYKYSYMEEMIGAIDNARHIFERWMAWDPDDMGWAAFIKFEMRQGEVDRARTIYERYIALLPTCRAYLKYARWEEKLRNRANGREIYERSLKELHPQEQKEKLLINFARFEERSKEFDRARVIYQYAITQLEKDGEDVTEIKKEFIAFEKRHGKKAEIEDVIINSRRKYYEDQVQADPCNYDTWFDYIRLEESERDTSKVRDVYERAIKNIPPIHEKRFWKRYIYLWINYAIYEELTSKDIEKARTVYKSCLQIIPHKKFSFGKIWLLAAQLEIRQRNIAGARKLLGQAIGMCGGKPNIFKGYIEIESQLGEIDRCRTIYGKFIEMLPHNCSAWQSFAQLEVNVGETTRARAIYELAISQMELDMPEILWKAYIDFEINEGEFQNAHNLYERLVEKTNHVKVWISFAQFAIQELKGVVGQDDKLASQRDGIEKVRGIFTRGYESLKEQGLKEERLLVLEAWRDFEYETWQSQLNAANGANGMDTKEDIREGLSFVESKFPKKIKMKRNKEDGGHANDEAEQPGSSGSGGMAANDEEYYYDYVFPDDEKKIVGMKLLENAMKWKQAIHPMDDQDDASSNH